MGLGDGMNSELNSNQCKTVHKVINAVEIYGNSVTVTKYSQNRTAFNMK